MWGKGRKLLGGQVGWCSCGGVEQADRETDGRRESKKSEETKDKKHLVRAPPCVLGRGQLGRGRGLETRGRNDTCCRVCRDYFFGFLAVRRGAIGQLLCAMWSGASRQLTPVLAPRDCPACHSAEVQRAAHNLVPAHSLTCQSYRAALSERETTTRGALCSGEVLSPASTDEDDRVLLQVVALAGDVGDDGPARAQLDLGHLADGTVGLARLDGVHFAADALLLEAALEGGRLVLSADGLASAAGDLVEGGLSRGRGGEGSGEGEGDGRGGGGGGRRGEDEAGGRGQGWAGGEGQSCE